MIAPLSCGVITLWWGMVVMTEWMDPCNIQYAKHVTRSHSSRAKGGWKSSSFLSSLVGLWSVRVNLNTITVMYANQLWLAILFWIAFWVNKMYPFMHNVVRKIILNLRVLLIRLVMISVMMRQQPFRTNLIERDGIHSLWLKKFVRDYNRENSVHVEKIGTLKLIVYATHFPCEWNFLDAYSRGLTLCHATLCILNTHKTPCPLLVSSHNNKHAQVKHLQFFVSQDIKFQGC